MKRTFIQKEVYSAPETRVFGVRMETGILVLSDGDVDLTGSGVDEGDADDNGNNIW
ncbi:MAG: hypothetical protein II527_04895 [Bacteroidales bacterium]|nr:hypothetical protein [Bacteroidales bacterium]MBQ1882170.1 hypothetical protein [Bacteroidales bacterium]MBQ2483320.1 hypothetical protein [Bacteroidales bacterium]MBQ2492652.1 hypothetical protein [Bacteroidales bacterium]MBQ4197841.1 hypothetical protein [Bacteroidales bacterium]